MSQVIDESLTELYSDYYETHDVAAKRAISAADAVDHIQALHSGALGNLLDVGAGNGNLLTEIAKRGLASRVSALEISASGISKIESLNLPILDRVDQFDGYQIPFEDKAFDTAICIHVIEHVEHERLLLKEIGRVAKDIFIEVPLEAGLRGRLNYEFGHINYYTPLTFRALIETSGLKIVEMKVFAPSLTYEQHVHGSGGGRVRNTLRNLLLKTLKNKAPELMTYHLMVRCQTANA
jgi:SAM-dependent methyltransferase